MSAPLLVVGPATTAERYCNCSCCGASRRTIGVWLVGAATWARLCRRCIVAALEAIRVPEDEKP